MQVSCVAYNNPNKLSNFKDPKDFEAYKEFGHHRWNSYFSGLKIISQEQINRNTFVYDLQFNIRDLYDIFDRKSSRHLFELLDVKFTTIDAVKRKQGYFLINITTEGIYDDWFTRGLQKYFKHYNIPLSQIIYINNAANGDEIHKEKRLKFKHLFVPPFILDYAYRESIDFRGSFEDKKFRFLCYNRNLHKHRIAFYTLMHKNNLLEKAIYSMPREYENKGTFKDLALDILDRERDYQILGIEKSDIAQAYKLLPISVDKEFDRSLINTSKDMWYHHKQSLISVVTETYFYGTKSIHITEKTFKPISFCQPFILLSTPGSLAYLRDLGFKTFDGFWDESYDTIDDPNERMKAVLYTVARINNWSGTMCKEFHRTIQPIVEFNKRHLAKVIEKQKVISNSIWRT